MQRATIYRALALGFGLLLLFYVLSGGGFSLGQLLDQQIETNWYFAFVALVCFAIHTLLVFWAWYYSLKLLGVIVPMPFAGMTFTSSLLARYLPGGVWHLGGRLVVLSRNGASPALIGASLVLEQMLALTMCFLLALVAIAISGVMPELGGAWTGPLKYGATIAIVATATLLWPPILVRILRGILIIFKRPMPALKMGVGCKGVSILYMLHAVALAIFALGYYFSVCVYLSNPPFSVIGFIGVTLLATSIGFITPFVPGGLGVREAILFGFLGQLGGGAVLGSAIVLPRVLLVIAEFLLFSAAILYFRRPRSAS